jgi:hypothetical protein
VTIEVADNGFPSIATQGQVIISLLNVNEPPVLSTADRYCLENSAVGYIVENPDDIGMGDSDKLGNDLSLAVIDPDLGDDVGNCCKSVVFSIDTLRQVCKPFFACLQRSSSATNRHVHTTRREYLILSRAPV